MSNYVQLGEVHTYYEEDGDGEPLLLLHPGLADSRAFEEHGPELARRFHVFRPDRRGHGRTPDVDGPITCCGVFHHDGWAPGAIDLDDATLAFFADYWGAVAPDGPDHFPVVKDKLDRMHLEEPTHTLALRDGLPDAQLAVLPGAGHGSLDARIVIDFLTEREEQA